MYKYCTKFYEEVFMKKITDIILASLIILLSYSACSNEGQDGTDETERRIEVESFELDEEAEFAKRQGQVGFFSTYDTKYAFAESEITELEDTFFAPHTVNFNSIEQNSHLYCEGEDGDLFMFDLLRGYDENNECNSSVINGILKIDKYGSAERICVDPYCADEESICNHMNLYGQPWEYYDNSLYFLCPKWYDEKGYFGSYLLEYSLDDRDFYKILDIPVGSFTDFRIKDGFAYMWCYNGGSSEVLQEGQSAVAVVDLDNNRACIYEDDIPIVCGVADGKIIGFFGTSSPSIIDPNEKKSTNLSSMHDTGWNTGSCVLVENCIIFNNRQTNELMIFDMETEDIKVIDENVSQFAAGENSVWYKKSDNALYSYDLSKKKRSSAAKEVRDFIVNSDSCFYFTSSEKEPSVLYYTQMQWVWSDDGETREYKEVINEIHAYTHASLWCCSDGDAKRLYQTGENEYISSMFHCLLGEEYAVAEIYLYDGEIRSCIDKSIIRMRLNGGRHEILGTVYGMGYYRMAEGSEIK